MVAKSRRKISSVWQKRAFAKHVIAGVCNLLGTHDRNGFHVCPRSFVVEYWGFIYKKSEVHG